MNYSESFENRKSSPDFSALQFNWRKKLPLVLQAESSECGLACLCMISQYYGHQLSLRELRQIMPVGQQGAKLQQIISLAGILGLRSRALKLELSELWQLSRPAILHWQFSHFVVLHKMSRQYVYIHDPAIGKRRLTWAQFSEGFTGIALEIKPTQSFTKTPKSKQLRLWHFVGDGKGIKRHLALLLGLSICIQIFVLLSPFYMQTVVDKVLLSSSSSLLLVLALGFSILLLIETFSSWLRETVLLRFSNLFNMHISSSVMAHLLALPWPYFQSRHMGDIVSRFSSIQAVRETLTQGLVSAVIDGILSITTLIVMWIYSWKLALIVFAFVVLYSLLRWILFYPIKRLNQEILQSDAKSNSYFMQSIRAIRTLKLSNTQDQSLANWTNYFVDNSNQRIKLGQWNIAFSNANKLLFGIENIAVIYVMATLVMDGAFTVGMLFAFVSYKARFIASSAGLIEKFIEYKILNVHLSRLEDILFEPKEIAHSPTQALARSASHQQFNKVNNKQMIDFVNPCVQVTNLSYLYPGSKTPAFTGVNFELKQGDYIAIIGESGCGKSTLLHCLLGLVPAQSGSIYVQGQALQANNRHEFNIAAVMQDDQLLNGSILDNISQFNENIDIAKAAHAAQIACIHQDIMSMTMQYQTLIGDMGSSLSGGQKQRILLARALYKNPDLLILDEATSHLDLHTEAQVCANLKQLNTSIIMVAHRPQTIAIANKIYALSSIGLTEIGYSNGNFQPKTNNEDSNHVK